MRKRYGIIAPLISPFKGNAIDHEAVGALLSFLKKSKVKGVFPAGSTGCTPLMSKEQHISIIKAYSESTPKGMDLFSGIGRNSVQETLEVAKAAIKYGATALVLVTPYYLHMQMEEVVRYYDRLLGEIDADVLAYNIPQFTGNRIGYDSFERIRKRHKNLIGIKDTSKDMLGLEELCSLPDDVMVFQGQDDLLLGSLDMGVSGGVCGTTNFDSTAVKLFDAYSEEDRKEAERLQAKVEKLMKVLATVEFPLGYHYAFYRKIMHKDTINALRPFYRNDTAYIHEMRRRMAGIL
ncbi:dihydrodipicolinate synthase family protein [Candidatus Marsarchaeota archaeon]|nr:dihydrodipicolinate synthase family protein [Candidatus Marsarchaeota archaeon]